jgi:hypothetical protein
MVVWVYGCVVYARGPAASSDACLSPTELDLIATVAHRVGWWEVGAPAKKE